MKIIDFDNAVKNDVTDYISLQLRNFFPISCLEQHVLRENIEGAVNRMIYCIERVVMWNNSELNLLHSSQYTQFLQYLSNEIWVKTNNTELPTKLFYLNKIMNGIDAFYEIKMPKVYFIGHSQGIVLAKAEYGENLVIYQNVTIGKNHGVGPKIGRNCIIYGGSAILGGSVLGDNCVVQYGTHLVDTVVPNSMLCTGGLNKNKFIKYNKTNIEDYIFT